MRLRQRGEFLMIIIAIESDADLLAAKRALRLAHGGEPMMVARRISARDED